MDTFTKSILQIANYALHLANFIQKACQRNIMDTLQSQYCKLRISNGKMPAWIWVWQENDPSQILTKKLDPNKSIQNVKNEKKLL